MLDKRLVEITADVFGLRNDEVTPEASRDTVADWDSVGHLRLLLAIEEEFGVRFPAAEIPKLSSVGAIQECLRALRP